jgi:transcriptional regulator
MPPRTTELIQGTLDLLILKSVSLAPLHGFGIARRIEQVSDGVFRVNPGSLLLAFQRLERQDLIEGEWRTSDNNRRARFYRLTAKGRRELATAERDWTARAAAMAKLLEV